jgi:hypothetical protein
MKQPVRYMLGIAQGVPRLEGEVFDGRRGLV